MIIDTAIYWMQWAYKNELFDEDIKYVVCDGNDEDKMDSEEFKKSRAVMARQMKRREKILQKPWEKNAKG